MPPRATILVSPLAEKTTREVFSPKIESSFNSRQAKTELTENSRATKMSPKTYDILTKQVSNKHTQYKEKMAKEVTSREASPE
jgi:hypothetical protein